MPTTTPAKGLTQPTIFSDSGGVWGTYLNTDLTLIDAALGGTLTLSISGNTTLTTTQAQNAGYKFSGTLSASATITWPAFAGFAVIQNNTTGGFAGFPLVCGIVGMSGKTVAVQPGTAIGIWSDGTNFIEIGLTPVIEGAAFGLLGDDFTDNTTAMTNFINAVNVTGRPGHIAFGKYRVRSSAMPAQKGGIIYGDGMPAGGNYRTAPQNIGTIIRNIETTSSDWRFALGFNGMGLMNLSFWPVHHKTGGFAIDCTGAYYPILENITFWYPYNVINDAGTTSLKAEELTVYNQFGPYGIYNTGWNGTEMYGGGGSRYSRVFSINTIPGTGNPGELPEPAATNTSGNVHEWTNSLPVNQWDYVHVPGAGGRFGAILVALNSGTTAATGSGPTLPSYNLSTDPTSTNIGPDGNVNYLWYCNDNAFFYCADSGTVWTIIGDSATTQGAYGVVTQHTHGSDGLSPPASVIIENLYTDSNWYQSVLDQAGFGLKVKGCNLQTSIASPVVQVNGSAAANRGDVQLINNSINGGGSASYTGGIGAVVQIDNGPKIVNLTGNDIYGAQGSAPAVYINNTGTSIFGGSIGDGAPSIGSTSGYGITLGPDASDYHLYPGRIGGFVAPINDLSSGTGEGPVATFSWNPVLRLNGSSTGITTSIATGTGFRIGNMVVLTFDLDGTLSSPENGPASIVNLPYMCGAASGVLMMQNYNGMARSIPGGIMGQVSAGGGAAFLYHGDGSGALVTSDFSAFNLLGTIIYSIAT